jgi:hypothetical protein
LPEKADLSAFADEDEDSSSGSASEEQPQIKSERLRAYLKAEGAKCKVSPFEPQTAERFLTRIFPDKEPLIEGVLYRRGCPCLLGAGGTSSRRELPYKAGSQSSVDLRLWGADFSQCKKATFALASGRLARAGTNRPQSQNPNIPYLGKVPP